MRVGRPLGKSSKVNQFLVTFRGKECRLLEEARQKAEKWDIPLKAIFVAALEKWVHGEISFERIKSNKDTFIIQRRQVIGKAKKLSTVDLIKQEPWYEEWLSGLESIGKSPDEDEED